MDRRSFFKNIGSVTAIASALPLLSLTVVEPTPTGTSINYNEGLFTEEQIRAAGFIPVNAPVFLDNGIAYSCSAWKLDVTFSSEIVQDLRNLHEVEAIKELNLVILDKIKELKTPNGRPLKYMWNVFKGSPVLDKVDFSMRNSLFVRGVAV